MGKSDHAIQNLQAEEPSVNVNSFEQRAGATSDGTVQSKKHAKAVHIESVDQLLHEIYVGTFKRMTLKKEETKAIRNSPKRAASEQEELLGQISSIDRTLDRTRHLLLLSVGLDMPAKISQIQEFVSAVLQRHPAFRTNLLREDLEYLLGSLKQDQAVEELAAQDYAKLNWPEGVKPLSKNEQKKCKDNAVCCLLLWLWITRKIISIENVINHLQAHLWRSGASRYKTDAEKLRALINTRDRAAVSITRTLMENQILQQIQRADAAIIAEEQVIALKEELEKKLADVMNMLTESQAEVGLLTQKLALKSQEQADERAHSKNEYEQLRGQILRRLRTELTLLDEGLQALRLEPPKIHVTIDHIERVIDALKREIDRLRKE